MLARALVTQVFAFAEAMQRELMLPSTELYLMMLKSKAFTGLIYQTSRLLHKTFRFSEELVHQRMEREHLVLRSIYKPIRAEINLTRMSSIRLVHLAHIVTPLVL